MEILVEIHHLRSQVADLESVIFVAVSLQAVQLFGFRVR